MQIVDINGKPRKCVTAYPDPSYPGFIKAEFKNRRRSYTEWYPVNDFMDKNPNFSPHDKKLMPQALEITRTATASSDIALTDKTQHWQINAYAGFPLWISRGRGEGQVRNVISNTKNTLIIDKQWKVKPDKFSQYVLSYNIHKHMPAVGNVLPEEIQDKYERLAKKMDKEAKKAQALAAD